jgi:hypothetical protein
VCGKQPGVAAKMLEQRPAVPRILRCNPLHAAQNIDGALRHVTQITERRGDYI